MAEIKSTMERVMERLARIEAASQDELDHEELTKNGMRLAARFMRGEISSFDKELEEIEPDKQRPVIRGIVETLLRNLVLPRDNDHLAGGDKAASGLKYLPGADAQLSAILSEVAQILNRYNEHRNQLRKQLEEAMRQQLQQAMEAKAPGLSMNLDPAMHPKFQEEWQRILVELNGQYGRVLEQHKETIRTRLA